MSEDTSRKPNFFVIISHRAIPWPFSWGPFGRHAPWPFSWGPFGGQKLSAFSADALRVDVYQRDGDSVASWPVTLKCGQESGRLVTAARHRDVSWMPQVTKA